LRGVKKCARTDFVNEGEMRQMTTVTTTTMTIPYENVFVSQTEKQYAVHVHVLKYLLELKIRGRPAKFH